MPRDRDAAQVAAQVRRQAEALLAQWALTPAPSTSSRPPGGSR